MGKFRAGTQRYGLIVLSQTQGVNRRLGAAKAQRVLVLESAATEAHPMKPFLPLLVLFIIVPAIGQENKLAQSKNALVGTWKLVSITNFADKGQVIKESSRISYLYA
jgi:hypothetical protein